MGSVFGLDAVAGSGKCDLLQIAEKGEQASVVARVKQKLLVHYFNEESSQRQESSVITRNCTCSSATHPTTNSTTSQLRLKRDDERNCREFLNDVFYQTHPPKFHYCLYNIASRKNERNLPTRMGARGHSNRSSFTMTLVRASTFPNLVGGGTAVGVEDTAEQEADSHMDVPAAAADHTWVAAQEGVQSRHRTVEVAVPRTPAVALPAAQVPHMDQWVGAQDQDCCHAHQSALCAESACMRIPRPRGSQQ